MCVMYEALVETNPQYYIRHTRIAEYDGKQVIFKSYWKPNEYGMRSLRFEAASEWENKYVHDMGLPSPGFTKLLDCIRVY